LLHISITVRRLIAICYADLINQPLFLSTILSPPQSFSMTGKPSNLPEGANPERENSMLEKRVERVLREVTSTWIG
jgi:hypothetical protein